jgi:gas vesicle protein
MDNKEKNFLIKKLIDTDEDAILDQVKTILGVNNQDFWDELPNHIKHSVDQAKQELKSDAGIPHDKVMSEIKRKFLRK